jgi:predicted transcriptional regulator
MVSRGGGKLVVTEKGLEYIEEFERITIFLRRMGLLP